MKTAISIPEPIFKLAERTAKRLGMSRSELFTRAVEQYVSAERDARITASYDEAFSDTGTDDITEFRRAAARSTVAAIQWRDE